MKSKRSYYETAKDEVDLLECIREADSHEGQAFSSYYNFKTTFSAKIRHNFAQLFHSRLHFRNTLCDGLWRSGAEPLQISSKKSISRNPSTSGQTNRAGIHSMSRFSTLKV